VLRHNTVADGVADDDEGPRPTRSSECPDEIATAEAYQVKAWKSIKMDGRTSRSRYAGARSAK
jgi:hypothetical protein